MPFSFTKKLFVLAIALVIYTGAFTYTAQASGVPPTILTYQGRLTDSSGNLLGGTGTNYYLKFSIWDSPTVGSGNKLWPLGSPATSTVSVTQGVFTVNIGDTANGYPDPLNLNFANNSSLYLQVEVSSNNISSETLSPRQQLTSSVFAQVAGAVVGTTTGSLFGTTTPIGSSFVTVQATSSTSIPLSIAGASGQSANLFQILNNGLSNLFSVSSTGAVTMASLGNFNGGFISTASSTITSGLFSANGGASTTVLSSTGSSYFATSGGSVGIATTSPASGFALAIQGNTYHSGTSYFGGAATFASGFNALGQSIFGNASSTAFSTNTFAAGATGTTSIASNGTLTAPNITIGTLGGLLKATGGVISAAVAGVDYANFLWPFTPTSYGVSTSTTVGFTNGLLSLASTTIGNGNQNGGLTINGGATTTGNSSIFGNLAIGTSTAPAGANLFLYSNNTSGANPALVIGGNPGGDTDFWLGRTNNNDSINNDSLSIGQTLVPGALPIATFDYNSRVGIGTSSPFAKLSIHANANDPTVNTTLFAIASSTATATTTLFSVSNTGVLTVNGSATSTFSSGVSSPYFSLTGTTASSTAANGFNLTAGCFAINNVCVGGASGVSLSVANTWTALQTFSSGASTTVLSSIGSAYFATSGGTVGVGTTTPALAAGQPSAFAVNGYANFNNLRLNGADTGNTINQTTGNLGITTTGGTITLGTSNGASNLFISTAGNVGVGTTTPVHQLAVSSTANGGNAWIESNANNAGLVLNNTQSGGRQFEFDSAGGSATLASSFYLNDNTGSKVTFLVNSSGDVGVGGNITSNALVGSLLSILHGGNVGIGSTTPGSLFSIGGNGTGTNFFDNATTTKNGVGGENIASGCFAVAGVCIGGGTGGASLTVANTWTQLQKFSGQASSTQESATQAYFGGTATSTFTTAGFLGIGTSTPNWNLEVAGTRPSFALTDSSAGVNLKHWLFSSMGGNLYVGTTTDSFATSSPTAFTILNNGSVGIGTSSPDSRFSIQGVNSLNQIFDVSTQAGAVAMHIASSGSVGIGTTSPNWQFQVAGTRPTFALSDSSAGTNLKHWLFSSMGGNLYIGTSTDAFATSSPSAFAIDTTGSTTITNGVNILGGCFAVKGTCLTTGGGGASLTVANTWTQLQQFNGNASTTQLSATQAYFGGTATSTFTTAGFLGIGTSTPNWNLQVAGTRPSIALSDMSAGTNLKHWLFTSEGGSLFIGTTTDAFATSSPAVLGFDQFGNATFGGNNINLPSGGTMTTYGSGTGYTYGSSGTTVISSGGNISLGSNTTVSGTLTVNGANDDLLFHAGNTSNIVMRQMADDLPVVSVLFGDSSAGGAMSIGTTSPNKNWAMNVAGTRPVLALTDNSGGKNLKHWLFSSQGGNLYIGTSTDVYATSTTPSFSLMNNGRVGVGTSTPTPGFGLSVQGGAYFSGTVSYTSSSFVFNSQSTTTLPTTGTGAWTLATSTAVAANPILSINSNTGTTTISFFGATTTGMTAGIGLGVNAGYKNGVIIGNGKVQSNVTITNGSLCVSGAGWCTASSTPTLGGSITARNFNTVATEDVAEMYPSDMQLKAGNLVAISSSTPNNVTLATVGNAQNMVGAVSTDPGFTLGEGPQSSGQYPIALSGQVPVYVNLDNGPIAPGDHIAVSTTTPGVGMKAGPLDPSVGVALGSYTAASSSNSILVFIQSRQGTDVPNVGKALGITQQAANAFSDIASALAELSDSALTTTTKLARFIVGEVVAKTAVVGSLFVQNLVASSAEIGTAAQPAGITMYDTATHAPYCLAVTNGAPTATPGVCGSTSQTAPVSNSGSSSNGGDATTTDNGDGSNTNATSTDSEN